MTKRNLILFLFISIIGLFSYADNSTEPIQQNKPIIIKRDPNQPRTPDFDSDITAFYQDGVIYLQFAYDMGNVEITVTNEMTGEQWSQIDDSAYGSATIATSTTAGDYYITIVTDDAICYSGSYSL